MQKGRGLPGGTLQFTCWEIISPARPALALPQEKRSAMRYSARGHADWSVRRFVRHLREKNGKSLFGSLWWPEALLRSPEKRNSTCWRIWTPPSLNWICLRARLKLEARLYFFDPLIPKVSFTAFGASLPFYSDLLGLCRHRFPKARFFQRICFDGLALVTL